MNTSATLTDYAEIPAATPRPGNCAESLSSSRLSAHPSSKAHRGRLRSLSRAKLAALWSSSISADRIGEAFGVSGAAVRWKAKALGLPPRGRDHVAKCSAKDFREMWLAGVHSGQIAQYFGYSSRQCASERAKRLGLPKRQHNAKPISLDQFREQQLGRLMAATT